VSVVCYQIDVSVSGYLLVWRSPTGCRVCLSVSLKLQQGGGHGPLGAVTPWGWWLPLST